MRVNDVVFWYDYIDQKEYFGEVRLLKKLDERYNQELWEVEINKNRKDEIWINKPTEWYRADRRLPEKSKFGIFESVNFSIDVMVIGYDKNNRLQYEISFYDFDKKEWDIKKIRKVYFWRYLDNPPISLNGITKENKNEKNVF